MDEDKEEEKLEREHQVEMKRLKDSLICKYGYIAKGKTLAQKIEDKEKHIKDKHLEMRPFEL